MNIENMELTKIRFYIELLSNIAGGKTPLVNGLTPNMKKALFDRYNGILEIKDMCNQCIQNPDVIKFMNPIIKEQLLNSLYETGIDEHLEGDE